MIETLKRLEAENDDCVKVRPHSSAGRHAHQILPGDLRLAQHDRKDHGDARSWRFRD